MIARVLSAALASLNERNNLLHVLQLVHVLKYKLGIRSVERGICPIATLYA